MKTLHQNIKINRTEGEVIANSKLFYYIDSDFKGWCLDKKENPAKTTELAVIEMTEDATFAQMFTKPDEMCLTQGQILAFVQDNKDKLRTGGYGTFFLFKVNGEFFVAHVHLHSGGCLHARVRRFSSDGVWVAGYRLRFVVPQLALKHFEPSPSDALTADLTLEARVKALEDWKEKVIKDSR